MGVCPCLELDNITLTYRLGYDFYIYGAFEFLCKSIVNYDVIFDITTTP